MSWMSTGDLKRLCEFVDALNDLGNVGGGVVIEQGTLVFCGEYEAFDCGHHVCPEDTVRASIEWLPDYEAGGTTSHEDGGYVITLITA